MKDLNKLDRDRIQKNYEQRLLETLNEGGFTVRVMKSSECSNLHNFANINELLKINQDTDKLKMQVQLINLQSAEFYRHLLVSYQGKPVACGCINITQAPIIVNKESDEQQTPLQTDNFLMDQPFQNFRAVI